MIKIVEKFEIDLVKLSQLQQNYFVVAITLLLIVICFTNDVQILKLCFAFGKCFFHLPFVTLI